MFKSMDNFMFSSKQASAKNMEAKNNTPVPDPEPQITQQTPTTKSELTQQVPITLPNPGQQVLQSMRRPIKPGPVSQIIQPSHRPIRSTRRPIPSRSSLVQAFRQILAQQNDAEYITLSSGDEDDDY
jgi:hypothetical protein